MPIFSSLDHFKEHKDYIPLLKKALLGVKPDAQKKFLFYKQFPFGAKKLPLVLVDFDANCQNALNKAGHKPSAEGTVALTTKDELNFEPKKGDLKRAGIQKYFSTMGSGIKPVYVPAGETDDEVSIDGGKPTPAQQVLARIAELRAKTFPPDVEKLKTTALDKAKSLADAGKFADATVLLDQLAAKTGDATKSGGSAQAAQPWPIDKLKAESDLQKRIAVCENLLNQKGGTASERDQVEDILAFAKKDWGVSQAKAAYATQMKGVDHKGDANTPAYNPDNKFDPKNLQQKDKIFKDEKVKKLMKSTGLTEGEVLAIRAYTASNYTYINPAIANQKDRTDKKGKDWMNTNRPDPSKATTPQEKKDLEAAQKIFDKGLADEKGSKKSLYEEGALHAGMMAEAFKKLPKKSGTLYRGARVTPEDFAKDYSKGKEMTYEAFASQSTSKEVARGFANGGGDKVPPAEATTSVFIEAQITDARDLQALSVYGNSEKEWLLPPGTKLRVEDVQDDSKRDAGKPPAKQWKKVIMKQV